MVTEDVSSLVIYYPRGDLSLKISAKSQPGCCPHRTRFFLNPRGCREVSHQRWHPSRNIVRLHYSAVPGERDHWKENTRLVFIFKHQEKLIITCAEFRWRVYTLRYIHLRCYVHVVFIRYLQRRPSPVPPWRRDWYGSSSRLCLIYRYHLPYSSSFTAAWCARVFYIFQKFLVWSRRCRSLPYFSIPSSSTEICLGVLFSGGCDMLIAVSLCSDASYFFLLTIFSMQLSNSAYLLTMCLNCL